jgi:hypothetical protein
VDNTFPSHNVVFANHFWSSANGGFTKVVIPRVLVTPRGEFIPYDTFARECFLTSMPTGGTSGSVMMQGQIWSWTNNIPSPFSNNLPFNCGEVDIPGSLLVRRWIV